MKKLLLLLAAFAANALSAQVVLELSWTDNSSNETGFVIERSVGAGPFVKLVDVATNVTTFKDTVEWATTYAYRVAAFNAVGKSAYTQAVTVTTPAEPQPPTAPSNLTVRIVPIAP